MKGLIMDALRLPTQPYCKGVCPESNLSKIVDRAGENAGLSTFTDAMAAQISALGGVLHKNSRVQSVQTSGVGKYSLQINGSFSVHASRLVLNLPAQPLLQLLRQSPSLTQQSAAGLNSLTLSRGASSMKLYVLYDDAWWINHLNRTYGYFNNTAALNTPACLNSGTAVSQRAPLSGRYHDGHTRQRPDGHWYGLLEAAYAFDDLSLAFYSSFIADAAQPFRVLQYNNSWDAQLLLDKVHAELVAYHADALRAARVIEYVESLRPRLGALSVWDRMAVGFGAGIHDWMRDSTGSCTSFSECELKMPQRVMQPLGAQHQLFVVNEAYGSRMGWCEGALVMAENVLHDFFGLQRPEWISADTYTEWVLYNSSSTLHSQLKMSSAHP